MAWSIEYPYKDVNKFILNLPAGLLARYLRLTDLMQSEGSNLGMPHTRSMSAGLFELRLKGKESVARVLYCTQTGERIIILHGFIKKTQKTPKKELRIANRRLAEVKKNGS